MIKGKIIRTYKLRRARWVKTPIGSGLECPKCRGRGSVWRDPNGHYSKNPYPCTTCLGKGIPPIPVSELE